MKNISCFLILCILSSSLYAQNGVVDELEEKTEQPQPAGQRLPHISGKPFCY